MRAHENPFRSSEIAKIRYRIEPERREVLLRRVLAEPGFHAIVGRQGTGKTTLMEDLWRQHVESLPDVAGVRVGLNRESSAALHRQTMRTVRGLGSGELLYFDGAEVVGRFRLAWMAGIVRRRGGHGIISLHRRRKGIPVLWETWADRAMMERLVGELYGREPDAELRKVAGEAFEAGKGNLREVFGACYREMAGRKVI